MTPFDGTPKTWQQMEERDSRIALQVYLQICREVRRRPDESEFASLQIDERESLLERSAAALNMDMSTLQQLAAAGRVWWRRTVWTWHIEVATETLPWKPLA